MTALSMRPSTLETFGLGTVHEIFKRGTLPVNAEHAVEQVFGKASDRGSLVISGASGIVGAGKTMQLAARLLPFGVPVIALDFPGAPDGIGKHYPGLADSFGPEQASRIMQGIIRLSYDGKHLPPQLAQMKPRFLLEAIPEILEAKKAHYGIFKSAFPEIEIRSVTSGFPSSELGVGIAHPAFPHHINKVWEIAPPKGSDITTLLWSLGMIPIPVGDRWSFVLDVLFCGVTLAALRYHQATGMPYWKIDKCVRKLVGPNPLRAHDAIGAKGADFLTWSCLHHLQKQYGDLFESTADLVERKESGQEWYPPDHFRPLVNWSLAGAEEDEFRVRILGPLLQMTALLLHEERAHLSQLNVIGELCAQFRRGVLAMIRGLGRDESLRIVKAYHALHPQAKGSWHPAAFERIETPAWQQLYVNAEHDGQVGVIAISRESYNGDVDAELSRAIDWLKREKIDRVIVSGDFHLSTQMVGADTSDFFPALGDKEVGSRISSGWSRTARRLHEEFRTSVGFINGKRCLGGMLELLMHCHALVATRGAVVGMPEVTLPVVPGMEGCHWPFRKADPSAWPQIVRMLLTGKTIMAEEAVGWLVDFAGPLEQSLAVAWKIATGGDHGIRLRSVEGRSLKERQKEVADIPPSEDPNIEAGRRAIMNCILESCSVPLAEALAVQARHSSDFMGSAPCRKGRIGQEFGKVMNV